MIKVSIDVAVVVLPTFLPLDTTDLHVCVCQQQNNDDSGWLSMLNVKSAWRFVGTSDFADRLETRACIIFKKSRAYDYFSKLRKSK